MRETRRQLTLFITEGKETIELIRAKFNPAQHDLIAAHVTLCRENEIGLLDKVIQNIRPVNIHKPLIIKFESPVRFADGKGVLIPAIERNDEFYNLRKVVLKGIYADPYQQHPHITLMHPRNSTCTDEIFEQIIQYELPVQLNFDAISLIEQKDGGKWTILKQFALY
ncbi:hypothetical protein GCM10023149_02310 [Mucilaginibacter gynuensis]|uniref:2'-5' RNA ligase superfamily protein n=1 Tax=Mucilaginibacter gynuensis TaxID=1302236 RepID=A0ABP8FQ34_9SPHI